MEPVDVGYGGPSTEYLVTDELRSGNALNYPTIWWTALGQPYRISPENALALTLQYEMQNDVISPRYDNVGQAVFAAMNRSAMGGASNSSLFKPRK